MQVVAALALLAGCAGESFAPVDVTVEVLPDVVTALRVTWSTDEPVAGYVEFGPDDDHGRCTPVEQEATTEHEALVLGLTAESAWYVRAVSAAPEGDVLGVDHVATTGSLPFDLPDLSVTGEGPQGYVVTSALGSACGPVVLDRDGQIAWYHLDGISAGLCTRARLSKDGSSVFYGVHEPSGGTIYRVGLDGTGREVVADGDFSHDFIELDDGTFAYIAFAARTPGTGAGEGIVELAPDGSRRDVWSAATIAVPGGGRPDEGGLISDTLTHANVLEYDDIDDRYYISLRNPSSILGIDRQSGEVAWRLGGEDATVELVEGTPTNYQHGFDFVGDGIVVLDNRGGDEDPSRVVEYALTDTTASERWVYVPDPEVFAYALGNVQRLDDGDTLVNWSSAGQLEIVTPDGDVTWQANSALATGFGYATFRESLYQQPTACGETW